MAARKKNSYLKIGKNYIEFMEKLFLALFKNYPYDLEYIKKIIKEVEKEKAKKGLIAAENIGEALKKFKKISK